MSEGACDIFPAIVKVEMPFDLHLLNFFVCLLFSFLVLP